MSDATCSLAAFAASLDFDAIPVPVIDRIEELLVDWFGSAVAGHGAPPVMHMAAFARAMGQAGGPSETIADRGSNSPWLAAMANAAASHVAEQDDVHNGAVFHPATCVAGYEVGIRVGEFLGRSHYKVFHTTGTAGTLAAAAAVGSLLCLDADQMQHAFGSAGTQSAGLWEFLRTGADSKQLHTAHAAGAGLLAAWLARDGFTGARDIFTGAQGMAAGMTRDPDPSRLDDRLGTRWTTLETSFKWHASCRHTHPAADALLSVMQGHGLEAADIVQVTAHVHQGALDVLGPVVRPTTVHQSKFSMGTVLALVARYGHAGVDEFERHYLSPETRAFRDCVTMVLDPEVDAAYPARWIGKVSVQTADGRVLHGRVDEPKGDPGNTLNRREITDKALQLARFSGGASASEMKAALEVLWQVADWPRVPRLLPEQGA